MAVDKASVIISPLAAKNLAAKQRRCTLVVQRGSEYSKCMDGAREVEKVVESCVYVR